MLTTSLHTDGSKVANRIKSDPAISVSLVIITKNEAANIARCIQSVPWADEIVVLDSGSQDATCQIAESLGARVFIEEWRGYRAQKQRATDLARNDWVLSLDADEALSPELADILRQALSQKESTLSAVSGFEVPRRSYYMNRWINHGGWYPDYQIRLFHRKRVHWGEGHVHERIRTGQMQRLTGGDLHHYPFGSLRKQIDTNNEYSSLAAKDLQENHKHFSILMLLLKPTFKFLECYIWKRGFLDGLPGFIIAVGAAYSMFLKWAKLWEFRIQSDSN